MNCCLWLTPPHSLSSSVVIRRRLLHLYVGNIRRHLCCSCATMQAGRRWVPQTKVVARQRSQIMLCISSALPHQFCRCLERLNASTSLQQQDSPGCQQCRMTVLQSCFCCPAASMPPASPVPPGHTQSAPTIAFAQQCHKSGRGRGSRCVCTAARLRSSCKHRHQGKHSWCRVKLLSTQICHPLFSGCQQTPNGLTTNA